MKTHRRPNAAFYGRRHGKALRSGQTESLRRVLPKLALNLDVPPPSDLASLFKIKVREVHLEIGFGGGEHLLHRLAESPGTGFIGVEPFVNGMAKLVSSFKGNLPDNLRLFDDDAVLLLDWLPPETIDAVDLLYPDPWPKKKHWKRRFVSGANLDRLARIIRPGGLFRFASDIDAYVNWTLMHCRTHESFEWQADCADDWRQPFRRWPGTRYEAKAIRQAKKPAYLAFRCR